MTNKTIILDCEVYRNFFYLGAKRLEDGVRAGFEFSSRNANFDRDLVRNVMRNNLTIGFNSITYDLPMIYAALSGMSNSDLKDASDHIIQNRVMWWQVERELNITIPEINHIDLFETNPAVKKGLKALNGSMHHEHLQELPYAHDKVLEDYEMDELIKYCQLGDIDGTEKLYNRMQEPIALRQLLRKIYDTRDLRSKSDAQVGEAILKTEVERKTKSRITKAIIPDGTKFRYEVPEWMSFKTPYMQSILKKISETDIVVKGGKVQFPKEFENFNIEFDGLKHTLGIGGLHSTESNRAVVSDDDDVLIDGDVASQYPNIIMKLGLFPKAMGPGFLPVYKSIIDTRLKAKANKDKATDKGLKIAINGSYGKLGSGYSVLFAPHLMVAVTLTGQLSLLMLIEAAHLAGIPVVSANTDGVVFKCPRDKFNGFILRDDGSTTDRLHKSPLQDIIEWWENVTSFNMEFAEYKAIYSQSVNSYIAIKPDGSFKRKGKLANHWRPELPWGGENTDYDPNREALKKAPSMTICADAVLGRILHGISPRDTITECKDIREFVTIVAANAGATWRGNFIGKMVRYYWSTDGEEIVKAKPNSTGNYDKVPKTDGARECMRLPDEFPDDIDYEKYIAEAEQILKDVGFYGAPEPKQKRIRLTKKNRLTVLQQWVVAA
jgi:hypothetical protein